MINRILPFIFLSLVTSINATEEYGDELETEFIFVDENVGNSMYLNTDEIEVDREREHLAESEPDEDSSITISDNETEEQPLLATQNPPIYVHSNTVYTNLYEGAIYVGSVAYNTVGSMLYATFYNAGVCIGTIRTCIVYSGKFVGNVVLNGGHTIRRWSGCAFNKFNQVMRDMYGLDDLFLHEE